MEKTIITISRKTGSGGHTIGEMLAKRLGFSFYDKEIIDEISKDLKISKEVVEENGEDISDNMYIDLASGFIPFSRSQKIPFEEIKNKQEKFINELAEKENCVIVGRNADYILRNNEHAFHVFICADMKYRVERTMKKQNLIGEERRIERELSIKDHSRALYYKYFTEREWALVDNYNLTLDTGIFSANQCVDLIINAIQKIKEGNENA